jgi:hypothetical protein
MPNIGHAIELIFQRMINQPGPYRITGYVEQGPQVLEGSGDDLALETVIEDMTFIAHDFIVPDSKNAQYPLHDPGYVFFALRFHDQMGVIAHQAETDKVKVIFFSGLFNDF